MSEKNENIIVLEEKVALLINKLKQNYLDIKNLSEELENLSLIKKDLDKDLLFFKEENKSLKIANKAKQAWPLPINSLSLNSHLGSDALNLRIFP